MSYWLEILRRAAQHRLSVLNLACDGVWRAFAGGPDGCPGLVVDHLGGLVWARVFDADLHGEVAAIHQALEQTFPDHLVYLAYRESGEALAWIRPSSPLSGFRELRQLHQQQEGYLIAKEAGPSFLVASQPTESLAGDFGLYADTRAARMWLAGRAAGQTVLNLFAYTCAFGVVASRAGATSVVNVDVSREALTIGKFNATANGCDFAVVPEDAARYVARLAVRLQKGRGQAPSLAVVDAPAFLSGRGDQRLLRRVLPRLLEDLFAIMPKGSCLLLSCNDKHLSEGGGRRVQDMVVACARASGRSLTATPVLQTPDVLGQDPRLIDPCYAPPLFWAFSV